MDEWAVWHRKQLAASSIAPPASRATPDPSRSSHRTDRIGNWAAFQLAASYVRLERDRRHGRHGPIDDPIRREFVAQRDEDRRSGGDPRHHVGDVRQRTGRPSGRAVADDPGPGARHRPDGRLVAGSQVDHDIGAGIAERGSDVVGAPARRQPRDRRVDRLQDHRPRPSEQALIRSKVGAPGRGEPVRSAVRRHPSHEVDRRGGPQGLDRRRDPRRDPRSIEQDGDAPSRDGTGVGRHGVRVVGGERAEASVAGHDETLPGSGRVSIWSVGVAVGQGATTCLVMLELPLNTRPSVRPIVATPGDPALLSVMVIRRLRWPDGATA